MNGFRFKFRPRILTVTRLLAKRDCVIAFVFDQERPPVRSHSKGYEYSWPTDLDVRTNELNATFIRHTKAEMHRTYVFDADWW
jgi:hypothetical protein